MKAVKTGGGGDGERRRSKDDVDGGCGERTPARKVWSVGASGDSKISFLLRDLPEDVSRMFLYDDVARFSITRSDQARELCVLLSKARILDPANSTICDGCACVGGNALLFDEFFAHTTCVELDPIRAALLRSNLLSNNPASFVNLHTTVVFIVFHAFLFCLSVLI